MILQHLYGIGVVALTAILMYVGIRFVGRYLREGKRPALYIGPSFLIMSISLLPNLAEYVAFLVGTNIDVSALLYLSASCVGISMVPWCRLLSVLNRRWNVLFLAAVSLLIAYLLSIMFLPGQLSFVPNEAGFLFYKIEMPASIFLVALFVVALTIVIGLMNVGLKDRCSTCGPTIFLFAVGCLLFLIFIILMQTGILSSTAWIIITAFTSVIFIISFHLPKFLIKIWIKKPPQQITSK
ncbi:MAG: hypothetical protein QXL15_00220 [Candidatus Korarchaeota archaeon]